MVMSSVHASPVVHLSDFLRCAITPHSTSDVHLSIQHRASSQIDKFEHGVQTARLLGHPLVIVLEINSGSTHRE